MEDFVQSDSTQKSDQLISYKNKPNSRNLRKKKILFYVLLIICAIIIVLSIPFLIGIYFMALLAFMFQDGSGSMFPTILWLLGIGIGALSVYFVGFFILNRILKIYSKKKLLLVLILALFVSALISIVDISFGITSRISREYYSYRFDNVEKATSLETIIEFCPSDKDDLIVASIPINLEKDIFVDAWVRGENNEKILPTHGDKFELYIDDQIPLEAVPDDNSIELERIKLSEGSHIINVVYNPKIIQPGAEYKLSTRIGGHFAEEGHYQTRKLFGGDLSVTISDDDYLNCEKLDLDSSYHNESFVDMAIALDTLLEDLHKKTGGFRPYKVQVEEDNLIIRIYTANKNWEANKNKYLLPELAKLLTKKGYENLITQDDTYVFSDGNNQFILYQDYPKGKIVLKFSDTVNSEYVNVKDSFKEKNPDIIDGIITESNEPKVVIPRLEHDNSMSQSEVGQLVESFLIIMGETYYVEETENSITYKYKLGFVSPAYYHEMARIGDYLEGIGFELNPIQDDKGTYHLSYKNNNGYEVIPKAEEPYVIITISR